ncbi:MAG: UDPGP type 1 family protein [Planctomycetia bacterium]|nr:UDPGP type 1 family protein [Planctomycetia bacterium]
MRDELQALLAPHGQDHLLAFWEGLSPAQREALAAEIRSIDFSQIAALYDKRDVVENVRDLVARAGSPRAFRLDAARNPFSPDEARQRGADALAAGQIGVILVAGGQATRLGFDHPKGMFPIAPVSGKSLFQIHIEKIVAAGKRYGARIPLYLMTSPATHEETVAFLERHDRFGLAEEDLHVFCQAAMPAVDAASGKVLLHAPDRLALSPDGHGGTLAALRSSGGLEDARRRGLAQLFYLQVDNPLVDVAGPEFVGYHLLAESELSTQVIAKRDPLERVGNVVEVDGRLHVVEYVEYNGLPDEIARRRNSDGSLAIWAGSIAVHVFDVAFLERMADRADALPFHVARKKVAHVDSRGTHIQPAETNAIKFERFIFDLLPWAARAIVVEVDPARAFAPLKNAPGKKTDTPETVRAQMAAEHAGWLRRAGIEVADDVAVEISPLLALDADELAKKITPGSPVTKPTYFC